MHPCPGCGRPVLLRQADTCVSCTDFAVGQDLDQLALDVMAFIAPALTEIDTRPRVYQALKQFSETLRDTIVHLPAPSLPLPAQVQMYRDNFRDYREAVKTYTQSVPLHHPAGEVWLLIKQCIESRRLYAFRLIMPKDALAYVEDTLSYYKWTTILCDGIRAAGQARREGRPMGELLHATVQALRQRYFDEWPAWNFVLLDEALREAGLSVDHVPLAGWVAVHLSAGPIRRQGKVRGNRLAQALKRGRARTGQSTRSIVDERIATAVHLAYAECNWKTLKDLYRQVSNEIYRDIVRDLSRPLDRPALFIPAPTEDVLEASQAAHDLAKLSAIAPLTPRERQVVTRTKHGSTPTEIAHALAMTRQSVEEYLARGIEKMRLNT